MFSRTSPSLCLSSAGFETKSASIFREEKEEREHRNPDGGRKIGGGRWGEEDTNNSALVSVFTKKIDLMISLKIVSAGL